MELRTSLKMQLFAIQHNVRIMLENADDPTGRTLRLLSCCRSLSLAVVLLAILIQFDERRIGGFQACQ
jgi:hypothetical protein